MTSPSQKSNRGSQNRAEETQSRFEPVRYISVACNSVAYYAAFSQTGYVDLSMRRNTLRYWRPTCLPECGSPQ